MIRDQGLSLPAGHSDRIISMCLPLCDQQHATLCSGYAPTLQGDPTDKDKFYSDLRSLLQDVPADDKIVILGDFNARMGRVSETWKGIIGRHGVGSCKDNGRLLFELCAEQQLSITNTIFQQKDSLKTTWMHPRSKHWHLIIYIPVRQRDLKDVFHTRVMPSAKCHTDHRLVCCKITFHIKPKPRKDGAPRKKLKVCSLQSGAVRAVFQKSLWSRLEEPICLADSPLAPEVLWDRIKTVVLQTSEDTLGFTTKKNRDWFNESNLEEISTQGTPGTTVLPV